MAYFDSNPALWFVHRLPFGRNALYCCPTRAGCYPLAVGLLCSGDGGGIAVMTVISGFLFEHYQGGVFWVMALIVIPALFIRPRVVATPEDLAS